MSLAPRLALCGIVLSTLLLAAATESFAVPITVPATLNPGDQYRLVFVTSAARDASSSNIADYNAFVSSVANGEAALLALGTQWSAIASTSAVEARDNTGTNPDTDGAGVAFYNLQGYLLANSNSDFWGGGLVNPIRYNESGNFPNVYEPWTGSLADGTAYSGWELGASSGFTGTGNTNNSGSQWIRYGVADNSAPNFLYAISDVLTVVPEPGTATLLVLGLAALAAARRNV